MKIIINSHINFGLALETLIHSMEENGFKKWDNVIVARGGCKHDTEPFHKKDLHNIVFVDIRNNFYDYNGHLMLTRMRDHSLIKDDAYMYIMDSCTVDDTFNSCINQIQDMMRDSGAVHMSAPCPSSNIGIFRKEFIDQWGDTFEFKNIAVQNEGSAPAINKGDALHFECFLLNLPGTKLLNERRNVGIKAMYKNNMFRVGFLYPELGLTKWILWGKDSAEYEGDFYK
jgi:hypothetical protein